MLGPPKHLGGLNKINYAFIHIIKQNGVLFVNVRWLKSTLNLISLAAYEKATKSFVRQAVLGASQTIVSKRCFKASTQRQLFVPLCQGRI